MIKILCSVYTDTDCFDNKFLENKTLRSRFKKLFFFRNLKLAHCLTVVNEKLMRQHVFIFNEFL